jgi:2-phospho-L-lactate guanylyltransferase
MQAEALNVTLLIPVKNSAEAKQRLASVLAQPARTELARAMLLDEIEALSRCPNRPQIVLVTSDPFALDLAKQFSLELIPDGDNRGETHAIAMATAQSIAAGAQSTLVIPGDIPLVTAADLQIVMDAAPPEGTVLVPASDGRGTNAVLRRPADLFPLRFGNDSFQPHLASARAAGKPCNVIHLPNIGLDVDSPFDLDRLAAAPGETRSQSLARAWGFGDFDKRRATS